MHEAIKVLMHEHRVIEQVLAALAATAEDARRGGEVSRTRIAELAEFFAGFADRCHHGKEEDLLFARLADHGFSIEGGPVGVMLAEHEQGRELVRVLAELGRGEGPLSPHDRESFATHALAYARLLAQHIAKEDGVLYPMALDALSIGELDELAGQFVEFEADVMGPGEHQRLHEAAERIIAATATAAAGHPAPVTSGCHSCGSDE